MRFEHYDWNCSYGVLQQTELKHSLILDVGCGDGRKTSIHKDFAKVLIGIDIDLKALREAKQKGILVVRGDATKLPFKNDSFDIVLSFHLIEHLKNSLAFINDIYRVLKITGYTIIITPNYRRLNSILYRLIKRPKEKYPFNPDHEFEYTKGDLEKLLSKSNFRYHTYTIEPIGFIRLRKLEISTCPIFLSAYCDQLMAILRKT